MSNPTRSIARAALTAAMCVLMALPASPSGAAGLSGRPQPARTNRALSFAVRTLPLARVGARYRVVLRAIGGQRPYVWSLDRTRPPAGIHLTRSGILAGTPRAAGHTRLIFQVRDARGRLVRRALVLRTVTSLPARFGPNSWVHGLQCPQPGACVASGMVDSHAAVETQTHGVWGAAQVIALPVKAAASSLTTLACAPNGKCAALGFYVPSAGGAGVPFGASNVSGAWRYTPFPTAQGQTSITSLACAPTAVCVAGLTVLVSGSFWSYDAAFINGSWGPAVPVSPTQPSAGPVVAGCAVTFCVTAGGTANTDGSGYTPFANLLSTTTGVWTSTPPAVFSPGVVTCLPDDSCLVAGIDSTGTSPAIYPLVKGVPGAPEVIPPADVLSPPFVTTALSCVDAANCVIGGYSVSSTGDGAWTAVEAHGVWSAPNRPAIGLGTSNDVTQISCAQAPSGTLCAVLGSFTPSAGSLSCYVSTVRSGTVLPGRPATTEVGVPIPGPGTTTSCAVVTTPDGHIHLALADASGAAAPTSYLADLFRAPATQLG